MAEAALSAGDRDAGGRGLRRAAALAQELGARPLSGDITLVARRARISLRGGDERPRPGQRPRPGSRTRAGTHGP